MSMPRSLLVVLGTLLGQSRFAESHQEHPIISTVNYTDVYDGALLVGRLAIPHDASSSDPRPAAVIFPDWDGVNEYEQKRAEMLAEELGYVALAADVFGGGMEVELIEDRVAQITLYRGNLTLSNARVSAAIGLVNDLEEVDSSKGVAILGYCFGGTLVLNHALSGSDEAVATVAFHGSLDAVTKDMNQTVKSNVLIISGGEDSMDSTKSVVDMEGTLNHGNATWELSRYSDVEHGFTVFGSGSYNELVDSRSWESTKTFLMETFQEKTLESNEPSPDDVSTEEIIYSDVDGTPLKGYVSHPDNGPDLSPAVIIIPAWSGVTDQERARAYLVSELLGYVGFAADIYGEEHGLDLADMGNKITLATKYHSNVTLFVQRIKAAIVQTQAIPGVDPNKIALFGYCFGGTGVINYAMVGESEAKGIVSFHGGLSNLAPVGSKINTRMLVLSGGDDDASSQLEDLENAMELGNATWEYTRWSDVLHSFTDWGANQGWSQYNLRADARSWASAANFLDEIFSDKVDTDTLTDMPTDMPTDSPNTKPADSGSWSTFHNGAVKVSFCVVILSGYLAVF